MRSKSSDVEGALSNLSGDPDPKTGTLDREHFWSKPTIGFVLANAVNKGRNTR